MCRDTVPPTSQRKASKHGPERAPVVWTTDRNCRDFTLGPLEHSLEYRTTPALDMAGLLSSRKRPQPRRPLPLVLTLPGAPVHSPVCGFSSPSAAWPPHCHVLFPALPSSPPSTPSKALQTPLLPHFSSLSNMPGSTRGQGGWEATAEAPNPMNVFRIVSFGEAFSLSCVLVMTWTLTHSRR